MDGLMNTTPPDGGKDELVFPIVSEKALGDHFAKTVDGRELHGFLQVDTDFKDWMPRRIAEYGFVEGKDFCSFLSESTGGRRRREYFVSIGMGKELGMVERNDRGRAIRKHFISIEEAATKSRPQTMAELVLQNAQVLVDLERRALEQDARINAVTSELAAVKQTHHILDKMPTECEGIERIRERMNKQYKLSAVVVDKIMRDSPYAPTMRALVRNPHQPEVANSGYSKKEVSAVFKRFVSECVQSAGVLHTHPYVEGRFRLVIKAEK
ncbi:antA/AntB antirepressor family protein [Agrobacterium rubi]|uniref:AntA/AntB antirepressor domain-containing protein n=1 Tax=Agrobacterium rubi TaxID=28099 RepID=A0ABX2J2I7_9HYPH|nr:antA/AntB antirepressor family protein [Agrobacterium rubi]NTF35529.1 hypothetical protein [Agrobacterium rubi]